MTRDGERAAAVIELLSLPDEDSLLDLKGGRRGHAMILEGNGNPEEIKRDFARAHLAHRVQDHKDASAVIVVRRLRIARRRRA